MHRNHGLRGRSAAVVYCRNVGNDGDDEPPVAVAAQKSATSTTVTQLINGNQFWLFDQACLAFRVSVGGKTGEMNECRSHVSGIHNYRQQIYYP
jgi:hypothetical protein